MTRFQTLFQDATGHAPRPWQDALAAEVAPLHRAIRVPTGYGKTLGVGLTWVYHRVVRADLAWPTRLVWVLPMRTLVEQTLDVMRQALHKLGLSDVPVHTLMGGADDGDWHLHPERAAILVGTQDMILSRALNRGYGLARARWPMDFGAISHDVLWVLDEVQLMGVGFATALQLAAFRTDEPSLRPSYTWSMSATLQPSWFSRSPDTVAYAQALARSELTPADQALPLWSGTTKPITTVEIGLKPRKLAERVVEEHRGEPGPRTTLVVCNTVERARELHAELAKLEHARDLPLTLLHSRFRGAERRAWASLLASPASSPNGRIIVATQVIEAGVDLSADLLFTELCPFASLVQRLGRLARFGGTGKAFIIPLDTAKQAAPYDSDALEATHLALTQLPDGSPQALAAFEQSNSHRLESLFAYDPPHFILHDEVHELFDTTADLSGGDIDVSRFIREGDERDLHIAWIDLSAAPRDPKGRPLPPAPSVRPSRAARCAVPFFMARDWLCGKGSKTSEPRRLREGMFAWVWDWSEGAYRLIERADLRPGAVVLVDAACGGYDPSRGFDPDKRDPVPTVPTIVADPQEQADSTWDDDALSAYPWQTIAFHGGSVAREVRSIAAALGLAPTSLATRCLDLAARWHDLGKAHEAFQGAIAGDTRPARHDLAKAPRASWRRGADMYRTSSGPRPGFRHELASALALFDVLVRHAPPDHPARLGPRAAPAAPPDATTPNALELEILALSRDEFDLVAFLVCAHHGKLRARLHMGPKDPLTTTGPAPIRGVYDGDTLPPTHLEAADGTLLELPASRLTLEPASLGLSEVTGPSWSDRIERLRERHGPFALAWLEAILRAADIRASMAPDLVDPAFAQMEADA